MEIKFNFSRLKITDILFWLYLIELICVMSVISYSLYFFYSKINVALNNYSFSSAGSNNGKLEFDISKFDKLISNVEQKSQKSDSIQLNNIFD